MIDKEAVLSSILSIGQDIESPFLNRNEKYLQANDYTITTVVPRNGKTRPLWS